MYLSDIKIEGYRLFKEKQILHLRKGLNVLVGENGCGKSTVIDAIRLLLNEDEYARNGISEEDFYSSVDKKEWVDNISIKGRFSDLSEDKKVEYITWLDKDYNAVLNIDIAKKQDRRNNYKKAIWGGESSNSVFEWEILNDIQCVYLPALRDAEKKLKASRGSRLARLLINLSQKTLEEKRKAGELMDIEKDVNDFNSELAKKPDIARANELINDSLENALGTVFAQTTKIRFGDVTFERIVEALRIVFFPGKVPTEENVYRNLFENSLGYNNLIYLATILAEFEGLKENYSSPRILLIEELEAHLHPQIQIKVLRYLKEQAEKNDIQIIITTHSATIASATPIENIISFNMAKNRIKITSLSRCVKNKQAKETESKDWKKLLFDIRNILKDAEQLKDFSVTWTEWKKLLNRLMVEKIETLPELSGCTYDIGNIRRGNKDKTVEKILFDNTEGDLVYPIETIHGCKGMSLDAVFFLSSYQASNDEHSGGYWKQWFNRENIGEENRLAYVAFSRARYLLALGIPKPQNFSEGDRKVLKDAGFEIIDN